MKFDLHPIGKAYRYFATSGEVSEFKKLFENELLSVKPENIIINRINIGIRYCVNNNTQINFFTDDLITIKFHIEDPYGITLEEYLLICDDENLKQKLLFNLNLFT